MVNILIKYLLKALVSLLVSPKLVGHDNTFLVLTHDTKKVIARSRLRLANELPNKRLEGIKEDSDNIDTKVKIETTSKGFKMINPFVGEDIKVDDIKFDKSAMVPPIDEEQQPMLMIPLNELKGRSFLLPVGEDGTRDRARIIKVYDDHKKRLANEPDFIKLRIKVNDEEYVESIAHNEMNNFIEDKFISQDGTWTFRKVLDHKGPLRKEDPEWMGYEYNVLIEWETGERTWEPTSLLDVDDHKVDLAIYAKEKGSLELPGWKQHKRLAKRKKKLD